MNDITILVLLIFGIVGLPMFIIGKEVGNFLTEKKLKKKIISPENVVACFKDVNWSTSTFETSSGNVLTDKKGESKFYSISSIDDAIEKLNVLLKSE